MTTPKMHSIKTTCPFCKEEKTINASKKEYERWRDTSAMPPYLSDNERELKTGLCKKCWNKLFSNSSH